MLSNNKTFIKTFNPLSTIFFLLNKLIYKFVKFVTWSWEDNNDFNDLHFLFKKDSYISGPCKENTVDIIWCLGVHCHWRVYMYNLLLLISLVLAHGVSYAVGSSSLNESMEAEMLPRVRQSIPTWGALKLFIYLIINFQEKKKTKFLQSRKS